jgi:hypothetical protein
MNFPKRCDCHRGVFLSYNNEPTKRDIAAIVLYCGHARLLTAAAAVAVDRRVGKGGAQLE